MPDWETRLGAMKGDLQAQNSPVQAVNTHDFGARVVELELADGDKSAVHEAIDRHFGAVDRLVSDRAIEAPQLFVSDMDSTMIGQECIDELADYAGLKPQIAEITEKAMRGELDFEDALRERVALLGGLDESAITRCLEERISGNPGAAELVMTLNASGARTVLVTGGFHHFADRVAQDMEFDRVVGNRLEVADGKLTGKLEGAISHAQTKLAVLREEAAAIGADAISVGIGDGANDIPMIEGATFGFAYMAKPAAKAAADGRIESGDLTKVLSLLGIRSGI